MLDGITHVIRGRRDVSNTPKQISDPARARRRPSRLRVRADARPAARSSRSGTGAVDRRAPRGWVHPGGATNFLALLAGARRPHDDHEPRRAGRALLPRTRPAEPGDVRLPEARVDERGLPASARFPRSTRSGCARTSASRATTGTRTRVGEGRAAGAGEDRHPLGQFQEFAGFLFHEVEPNGAPHSTTACSRLRAKRLPGADPFDAQTIEAVLREMADRLGLEPRQAFQPIRVAVTGSTVSPGLFESLELLGKEQSIARLPLQRCERKSWSWRRPSTSPGSGGTSSSVPRRHARFASARRRSRSRPGSSHGACRPVLRRSARCVARGRGRRTGCG